MPWFRRSDGSFGAKDESKLDDVEFKPEDFKKDLETTFTTKLTEMQTAQDAKFAPMFEMAAQLKADREARETAAKKANEAKNREDNQVTDEDFLLDPGGAVDRKLQGPTNAILMLASREARREVLAELPYYHGELKTKIDAFIDSQPLANRSDASVIMNAYKLTVYDADQAIKDGKIKARNSAMNFESNGTGAHSGSETKDGMEALTAEEKFIASRMGVSETDWAKSKKEMSFV